MPLTPSNLVGYQRSEFKKAAQLRVWLFFLQLAAAIPAAVSVLIPDTYQNLLYWLAVSAAAFLLLWWFLNKRYSAVRNAAQAARRAAIFLGAYDYELSPSEVQSLRERFTVTETTARKAEKDDYFASNLRPGVSRLGEMLEESAFYSEHLQKISAHTMLAILGLFAFALIVITLGFYPYVERDTAVSSVRIFLALLVFAMSADVIGAYFAHSSAARELRDIRNRLIAADASGYPGPDILIILMDYNAAVESSPEHVPFAYRINAHHLEQRWTEYKSDRNERRSA